MSAPKRAGRKAKPDPGSTLDAYRRIRKAMPPPERVLPDKRRKRAARIVQQELREESP